MLTEHIQCSTMVGEDNMENEKKAFLMTKFLLSSTPTTLPIKTTNLLMKPLIRPLFNPLKRIKFKPESNRYNIIEQISTK